MKRKQVIIRCLNCKKDFSVAISKAKLGKRYCSKICLFTCPIFKENCHKSAIKQWKDGKGVSPWTNGMPENYKKNLSRKLSGKPNPSARNNPQLFKKGHKPWNKNKKWPEKSGKNHHRWKGGKTVAKGGYIKLLVKEHPNADCYGYILRSHLVVEKCIGRFLQKREVIHHIDHNRTNDIPANLYLFSCQAKHGIFHKNETVLTSNLKELKSV